MPIASTAADDVRRQVCRLESPRRVSFRSEQERAVLQSLEDELRVQLLPRDPLDEKNIMLEIRAGTGGDEASIWAGDLLRMYERYCLTQVRPDS